MRWSNLALLPHIFHIFGPFTSDNDVQEAVVQWFRQQHKEIFADGIYWRASMGSLYICLWRIFLTVTITSRLQVSSGVGFIGTCHIQGRFLCGSWQVQMAYFVMKSDTSSNRPRSGTLPCTNFFTPLERYCFDGIMPEINHLRTDIIVQEYTTTDVSQLHL